jgi:2-C-methyl-D-erythritol 4-phosphate cytidylyltransferase
MRVSAILLAAGKGERMGAEIPKGFLMLAGKPMFLHSFEKFVEIADELALTVPQGFARQALGILLKRYDGWKHLDPGKDDEATLETPQGKRVRIVRGGKERQDSVERGLKATGHGEIAVVHDTARALITSRAIQRVIEAAPAIVAIPAFDTLKEVGKNGAIVKTLDRSKIWLAQTPQAFPMPMFKKAFAEAKKRGFRGTDCASLVEKLRKEIAVVPPDGPNLKITTPDDFAIAEMILSRRS